MSSTAAVKSTKPIMLPLKVVDGYPLVQCAVDGSRGWMLFDTGTDGSMLLNTASKDFSKEGLVKKGEGTYSSGQRFVVYAKTVESLDCGSLRVSHFEAYAADQTDQDKAMGGNLIGFIGRRIMNDYAVVFDFSRSIVLLYAFDEKDDPKEMDLAYTHPAVVIPYHSIAGQPSPVTDVSLGTTMKRLDGIAVFDSGANLNSLVGGIEKDKARSPNVKREGKKDADGTPLYRSKIAFDGAYGKIFDLNDLTLQQSNEGAEPQPFVVTIGYPFLKEHVTLWNFRKHQISIF
ncbi:aspartyl protease family protein [Granulicella sp. L60]|uniref:aspartyl protease family protein n=1 Tax=Granulicella sp. L60 TaxID=1641866 RepID=UPI00131C9D93|nr:retropepsin-like aspartic protease [Granulicella sp. L60]